jgi:hypothetical protein
MEDDMSVNDFKNEDGHGGLSLDGVEERQHWLNEGFRRCVEKMLYAVREFQVECPDGGVMTGAEEIEFEAVLHDMVTSVLERDFDAVSKRLVDAGRSDDRWESRWAQIRRQDRLGGAL